MNKTQQNLQFKWNDEDVNLETGEVDPNFIYAEDEPPEIEDTLDLELPDVSKTEIVESDIFDESSEEEYLDVQPPDQVPIIKEVVVPEEVKPVAEVKLPEHVPPLAAVHQTLNKNGKPRKTRKPLTDQQRKVNLENLRLAREKRKQSKGKAQLEKQKVIKKQTLMKQKEDLDLELLEEEVSDKQEEVSQLKQPVEKKNKKGLTPEEIKQIQLDAILEYDTLRKSRKAKKNEAKMVQAEKEKLKQNLQMEMKQGWQATAGKWSTYY
tara:strand:- start:145 stop:939 length:795 start_codon:yes stop_codon:yes gene_type:complete